MPTKTKTKRSTSMISARKYRPYKKQRIYPTVGLYLRNKEVKHVDSVISSRISSTANFNLLNAIRVGSNDYQRIAKDVKNVSLYITGGIQWDQQANNSTDYMRLMLVYDRQANGVTPVIGDILQNVTTTGATSSTSFDHYNHSNAERFKILWDHHINICQDRQTGTPAYTEHSPISAVPFEFKRWINLKGLTTKYLSDAADITGITSGAIYFITYGFVAANSANHIANVRTRLKYVDY